MRKIYAEIELDESVGDRYAETNGLGESSPVALLEKEFGWLEQSGFTLDNAFVSDGDDGDMWLRYLGYLMNFAMRRSFAESTRENPLTWNEWYRRETEGPVALVGPRFARTLIEDLGNGEPTQNDERTSKYHEIASGRGTTAGRTCKAALIERTVGYGLDKDYYELHIINDIDMSGCKLLYTEHLSEEELYHLLKDTLNKLERGEDL